MNQNCKKQSDASKPDTIFFQDKKLRKYSINFYGKGAI